MTDRVVSPAKRQLLEQALKGRVKLAGAGSRQLVKRATARAPLSYGQLRLLQWHRSHENPERALNLFYLLRILGPLDHVRLQNALQSVVDRHENLRMRVVDDAGGEPFAEFERSLTVELPVIDLTGIPRALAEDHARQLGTQAGLQPFDVFVAPLGRAVLYRIAANHHVFSLAIHHLIFDEWSMGVFVAELGALYLALERGDGAGLPGLPIQYGDFAVCERGWLSTQTTAEHRRYWATQLSGELPKLNLPGRKQPDPGNPAYGRMDIELPAGLSDQVRRFSREHDTSPFMTLVTVLAVVLGRLAERDDIIVTVPAANRTHPDLHALIGFFVNNLPLRISIGGNPTFIDLLQRVRSAAVSCFAYQDYPSAWMSELRTGDRSRPVSQIAFSFQNSPVPKFELGGLSLEPLFLGYGITTVDLSIFLIDASTLTNSSELAGMIQFDASAYERAVVAELWAAYQGCLCGMLATPQAPIAEVSFQFNAGRNQ